MSSSSGGVGNGSSGGLAPSGNALVAALVLSAACLLGTDSEAQEPGSRPTSERLPYGDPQALSVGVPVRIQDALTTPQGDLIFLTTVAPAYVDTINGFSAPSAETVKYGAFPGVGVNLAVAHTFGPDTPDGVSVSPSVQFVPFNNGGFDNGLPIMAFSLSYATPSGTGFDHGEVGIDAQLTQPLGRSELAPRLHTNFEYTRILDDSPLLRSQTFGGGVGLSFLINERSAFVGDVFYAQNPSHGSDQIFVDAGASYLPARGLALSAGVGVGANDSEIAGRLFFSLSKSFQVADRTDP